MLDDDDRDSAASSDNDNDEVMEDVDDENNDDNGDNDDDNEDDNEEEEDDNDGDADADADADADVEGGDGDHEDNNDGDHEMGESSKPDTDDATSTDPATDHFLGATATHGIQTRPSLRPETITARIYDIVPTMAAPQSTSINALSVTPDMRYIMTGGADGYIRKYDGVATINGKLPLTVAQRHPFVDSVFKAGVLMGYWENEEPGPPGTVGGTKEEHVLSHVYSLAVHSQALWVLSGLDSGCINLQTVRHDEGKRIASLQEHTNAVSVLTLAPDEKSVLSGSWDKRILSWDLNTGKVARSFDGSGGQISAIELRPTGGISIPAEAALDEPPSDTLSCNDAFRSNPLFGSKKANPFAPAPPQNGVPDPQPSPAHESLFGGSDAGSLFGDDVGGGGFGTSEGFGDFEHGTDISMGSGADELFGQSLDNLEAPADSQVTLPDTQATQDIAPEAPVEAQPPAPEDTKEEIKVEPEPKDEPMALDLSMETVPASQEDPDDSGEPMSLSLAMDGRSSASEKPLSLSMGSPLSESTEPGTVSESTFMSAAIDGTIRIWDRRTPNPVAKISSPRGTPPWCMAATWSPDGNFIYVGRRNTTVEEYSVHKARGGWQPERQLRFPNGSGAISALRAMPNGRHLICASHDILRLYDLKDTNTAKHSVPFLIVPGPPRAGVISHLHMDPTGRFMISTSGTRGWEGTSTEVLIGYEISCLQE